MTFLSKIKHIVLMLAFTLMLSSCSQNTSDNSDSINVTASFYPIYIIAQNVTQGISGINLQNMAQPQTGCLHDYQLSTNDMKKLSNTDLFIVNGGGMETFLTNALELFPDLKIIDTSEGIHALESSHIHDKEEDGHYHEHEHSHGHEHEHSHEHNPHFWILPENAAIQAQNICNALCDIYPEKSDDLKNNTNKFIEEINSIETFNGKGLKACVFNEAFDYLETAYSIDVELCIEMDENETPSAKELAEIIDTVNKDHIDLLIAADDASKAIADVIARETEAEVIVLDPVLTGKFESSAYIDALNNNARILKGSVKK